MLELDNLHARVVPEDGPAREILKGLSLTVPAGEVHAIMGPNGSGKSTLSYVLTGRHGYEVTAGSATFEGEDLLALPPEARAAKGLFLSFQYPLEIAGVPVMTFVRAAMNAQRKARGETEVSAPEFLKTARETAAQLRIDPEMLKRPLNVGFSGGEKKRLEIYQMLMLQPRFMILDETDSGLDIDALKVVADGVNALRSRRSLDAGDHALPAPARLHQTGSRAHPVGGRIVKSGGPELALELEKYGYDGVIAEKA